MSRSRFEQKIFRKQVKIVKVTSTWLVTKFVFPTEFIEVFSAEIKQRRMMGYYMSDDDLEEIRKEVVVA